MTTPTRKNAVIVVLHAAQKLWQGIRLEFQATPAKAGRILLEQYNSQTKAQQLIDGGHLFWLEDNPAETLSYARNFNKNPHEFRGMIAKTAPQIIDGIGSDCAFAYVWDGSQWATQNIQQAWDF